MDFRDARGLVDPGDSSSSDSSPGRSVISSGGIVVLSARCRIHRCSVTRGRDGAVDMDSRGISGQRTPEQYFRYYRLRQHRHCPFKK